MFGVDLFFPGQAELLLGRENSAASFSEVIVSDQLSHVVLSRYDNQDKSGYYASFVSVRARYSRLNRPTSIQFVLPTLLFSSIAFCYLV